MHKFCPKVPITTRTYIWLYRILSITFGGVMIDSTGKLTVNKYLKFLGYFGFIAITISTILGFLHQRNSYMAALSYSESVKPYYMTCSSILMQMLHISVNLWYINRNGIKSFVKIYIKKILSRFFDNRFHIFNSVLKNFPKFKI
jgi:hypothetical protein